MKPNNRLAEQHLKNLDPKNRKGFTFQTFDDNQDRNDPSLAKVFHGTLEDHWKAMKKLSKKGAAISVTVNETDFRGRSASNIVRIRGFWVEDDEGSNIPLPLKPHFIVESSPGKFHKYFLVKGIALDEFSAIQKRMVTDYGSDPNATDISRALRLCGFPHQKVSKAKGLTGEPFMVRVISS